MSESCANIGPIGIRRRMIGGVVWLVLSAAIVAVMFAVHASPLGRAWIVVPLFLSATGFFQARAKTCVALVQANRRDRDAGGPVTEAERPILRRQANVVLIKSAAAALVVAAVVCAI